MKIVFLLLVAALGAAGQSPISKEEKKDGFQPLYNRRNLHQWKGDRRLWHVRNGVIVGSTDDLQIEHNTFLIHKKEVGNFDLRFQVKLRNGNSGVQFRSEELPDFVVRGLQADMAHYNWWGSIYDERGKRGVIVDGWTGKAEKTVKADDWNDYEIIANGENITLKVNGVVTAELKDSSRTTGVLALQLHRGPGMKVYFRNMRIKRLPLMPERLAIFGGTFDPIHNAHLEVAREAARRFALDRVLVIPNGNPPHKQGVERVAWADRYRMVELACAGDKHLSPSRLEEGQARSYSIHTIERVKAAHPDDHIFFLIGADAFAEIRTWHRWEEVLAAVEFIVVSRPGHRYDIPEGARTLALENVALDLSSSDVRTELRAGRMPSAALPDAVREYIVSHGLYGYTAAGTR